MDAVFPAAVRTSAEQPDVVDGRGSAGGRNSTTTGNELTSDGTWDYTYDLARNETKKVPDGGGVSWTYGYDNKNELVQAQEWSNDPASSRHQGNESSGRA